MIFDFCVYDQKPQKMFSSKLLDATLTCGQHAKDAKLHHPLFTIPVFQGAKLKVIFLESADNLNCITFHTNKEIIDFMKGQ